MKGRYLIVAAVVVLSVFVLTLPSESENVSAVPYSVNDLTNHEQIPTSGNAIEYTGGGLTVTVVCTELHRCERRQTLPHRIRAG